MFLKDGKFLMLSLSIVVIAQSQDELQDVIVFRNPDAPVATPHAPHAPLAPLAPHTPFTPLTPASDASQDAINEFRTSARVYRVDRFDWSLVEHVASISNETFLVSPLALKLVLSLLTEAATGRTQAELNSVLGYDLDRNKVRRKFSTLLDSLQGTPTSHYVLDWGSRFYLDNIEPRARYKAIAENYYRTELKAVDFKSPSDVSNEINGWVSNFSAAHGMITNLVDEDDVMGSVMLLLNTLYFKGSWLHQFPPRETKIAQFFVSPSWKKDTPFMRVKHMFYYTESSRFDAKIVRLPYLGKKFSMYIVVPNSLTGLPRVLNSVNEIHSELYLLREHPVEVTLPKFHFEYTSPFDSILKQLGMKEMFEDTASFLGLVRGRIRVSKVLQRAVIEVDELGSAAADSATETGLGNLTVYKEVIADKPFLFFITDESMRELLFIGRVTDPSVQDGALNLRLPTDSLRPPYVLTSN